MSVTRVPLEIFKSDIALYVELSSDALGGKVVSVSDEFFAEAFHLIKVEPAASLKGSFGPNGALFSGWETRRHNPTYDWCIIKLGAPGSIYAFDLDTSHFNGNEAPEVSVEGLFTKEEPPNATDNRWTEILPKVPLRPNSRHLFKLANVKESDQFNYVKLNMYPDGGIARFRVYGIVNAVLPEDKSKLIDLAHIYNGGRVVYVSNQHFGVGSNLLLPGRGKDMGDGWETKRSRAKDHKDWIIIKLGGPGILDFAEIDTNHFKGNFPESCELHACHSDSVTPQVLEEEWIQVLPRKKLGPHQQHYFQLQDADGIVFTHVRLTIYPDGGIKRVRIMGRPYDDFHQETPSLPANKVINGVMNKVTSDIHSSTSATGVHAHIPTIPALPLTAGAFTAFGQVLMAWKEPTAVPKGVKVTSANQGTAHKFHLLSNVESSYPCDQNARTGFSVYRSSPSGAEFGGVWEVKLLERHPYTNQAFIPMGTSGARDDELPHTGRAYLVIVALNGADDKPDLDSLKAFIATSSQGIVYNTGIWHHPMITLEKSIDFTCVETQVGDGSKLDCEIVEIPKPPYVYVPDFE